MNVSKLLVAIILLTQTCGLLAAQTPAPARAESPSGENRLANTQWRLASFGRSGSESPAVEGTSVTLEFGADGRAGGSGGCNSYRGNYQVRNDRLSFGQIISTKKACVDERANQQERRYFQALGSAARFELTDGRLVIFHDGERGALNFVTAPAPKSSAAGQQSTDSQTAQRSAAGVDDEEAIRAIHLRMIDAWNKGSGEGFAAPFAEAADFIAFEGTRLKGRKEIVSFHQPLFDSSLKGTRLEGEVKFVRFLNPRLAVMHSVVRVLLPGQTVASPSRDSMQLYVVEKRDGEWRVEGMLNARRLTLERQLFLDDLDSLPAESRRQVTDLAASLKRRHQPPKR
jgi:uncharacterized protein (TIGR02246 family)